MLKYVQFNTLHTVCLLRGLYICEIKRICHRAYFFKKNLRWKFLEFDEFSKNNNAGSKYLAKTVVIFGQFLSFNLNYCP